MKNMSIRLKCNKCHHEFTVVKLGSDLSCPFCSSANISAKTGAYLISTPLLKKLIVVEIIVITLIISLIAVRYSEGPKIKNVVANKKDHLINVAVNTSLLKTKLEYSFDNGKTYQNNNVYKVTQPGTYKIIVRDERNRKNEWNIPVTFSDEDFEILAEHSSPDLLILPPQITGVELINESIQDRRDGQIIIHSIDGRKPIRYSIDGGLTFSDDSIFSNLEPGRHTVYVVDNDSQIDTWPDPILLIQGAYKEAEFARHQPPSLHKVENILNKFFSDPDNNILRDSLQGYFVNQTMNVECELIDIPPNTPYQLFQFLQRRYEGQPGSKRIQVLDIGYDNMNRINKLKVKETRVLTGS